MAQVSPEWDPLLGSQRGTCCVLIPHPNPCSSPGKGLDLSGIIGKVQEALAEVKLLLTGLCFWRISVLSLKVLLIGCEAEAAAAGAAPGAGSEDNYQGMIPWPSAGLLSLLAASAAVWEGELIPDPPWWGRAGSAFPVRRSGRSLCRSAGARSCLGWTGIRGPWDLLDVGVFL